jgi:hypothetical protein
MGHVMDESRYVGRSLSLNGTAGGFYLLEAGNSKDNRRPFDCADHDEAMICFAQDDKFAGMGTVLRGWHRIFGDGRHVSNGDRVCIKWRCRSDLANFRARSRLLAPNCVEEGKRSSRSFGCAAHEEAVI